MRFEISPGVVVDPGVRAGKPVIKGTRVPVDVVLGRMAGGATYDEIMREYDLTRDQILAARLVPFRQQAPPPVLALVEEGVAAWRGGKDSKSARRLTGPTSGGYTGVKGGGFRGRRG